MDNTQYLYVLRKLTSRRTCCYKTRQNVSTTC